MGRALLNRDLEIAAPSPWKVHVAPCTPLRGRSVRSSRKRRSKAAHPRMLVEWRMVIKPFEFHPSNEDTIETRPGRSVRKTRLGSSSDSFTSHQDGSRLPALGCLALTSAQPFTIYRMQPIEGHGPAKPCCSVDAQSYEKRPPDSCQLSAFATNSCTRVLAKSRCRIHTLPGWRWLEHFDTATSLPSRHRGARTAACAMRSRTRERFSRIAAATGKSLVIKDGATSSRQRPLKF